MEDGAGAGAHEHLDQHVSGDVLAGRDGHRHRARGRTVAVEHALVVKELLREDDHTLNDRLVVGGDDEVAALPLRAHLKPRAHVRRGGDHRRRRARGPAGHRRRRVLQNAPLGVHLGRVRLGSDPNGPQVGLVALELPQELLLPLVELHQRGLLLPVIHQLSSQLRPPRQVPSHLPVRPAADHLVPAVHAVVRLYDGTERLREVVPEYHLPRALRPHLEFPVGPARDELRHPIAVQVEALNTRHLVLRFDAPHAGGAVVHPDGTVGERVAVAGVDHATQPHHAVRLCRLAHHLVVLKDPDLKILRAHEQLVDAIVIDIAERHGAHVIARYSPELLLPLHVEPLDRAVATHDGQGCVDATHAPEYHRRHAVRHLLEEHVRVFVNIVREEVRHRPHHQHVPLLGRVERSRCHARDLLLDIEVLHVVGRPIFALGVG
mmetsp:Transcript_15490/g.48735  ORF Transcript_15490/g.48735 Transcript_15490/m.48735 type:complete len:434 (-) Transcript_15490:314-1615(-)